MAPDTAPDRETMGFLLLFKDSGNPMNNFNTLSNRFIN